MRRQYSDAGEYDDSVEVVLRRMRMTLDPVIVVFGAYDQILLSETGEAVFPMVAANNDLFLESRKYSGGCRKPLSAVSTTKASPKCAVGAAWRLLIEYQSLSAHFAR